MGGHRAAHRPHPADRPRAQPGRVPGARLHVEHRHGGGGADPPGGPVGADPADPGRHAGHAAPADRDRLPVHLLGAGAPGGDATGLRAAGRGGDIAVRAARPDARPGRGAAERADGQAGRRDRDHPGADLHDLGRARRRLLRRHRGGGRRVAVHRPRLYQGPGRPADAGAGPHADPGGAGAARRQTAGAARALHDRAVAAGLPGRSRPGRLRAADRLRRAGRRVLAARRAAGGGEPARPRAHGGRGRPAAGRGGALLQPAGRGRGTAVRPGRSRTTRRSPGTSWPAAC